MNNVGIIGSGSLGTAFAQLISGNGYNVTLLSKRKESMLNINKTGYNKEYYSNIKLNSNIIATIDYDDLKKCEIIFLTVPSSAFRSVIKNLKNIINSKTILVTTVKGIEFHSLSTMGKIISSELQRTDYVTLSGPNFASEIILNLPTITNISSNNEEITLKIKQILENDQFKVRIIPDLNGLEISGILKNILAISNGICEGMNLNENAKYAVLTKGINEMIEIIYSVGGNKNTILEYCGLGDMLLTSTSIKSRNHTLGILNGQKIIVDEKETGILFEGKNSIKSIKKICIINGIDSLIVNFVYDILINKVQPNLAFNELWKKINKE